MIVRLGCAVIGFALLIGGLTGCWRALNGVNLLALTVGSGFTVMGMVLIAAAAFPGEQDAG